MKIEEILAKKFDQKQDALKAYPGLLGDGKGQVVAGPGLVYVQIDDMVITAECVNVAPVYGLEVWVGYDQNHIFRVLGQRISTHYSISMPSVSSHAEMHELFGSGPLGGTDVIKVQLPQFAPLAVWPYDRLRVTIYPGIIWINNGYQLIADLNEYGKPIPKIIDFALYPAPDAGKEMYYLIGIDENGDVQVVPGNQVDLGMITLSDIPSPPGNMVYTLAAVRRANNQDAITINRESTDIVDLRFPIRHTHSDYLKSDALINELSDVDITSPQNGDVLGYDANTQTWRNRSGGSGDMLKSVYDTDNDGVVDAAEIVEWAGVQNKPTLFPPSAHTHLLSDVTGHNKAAHDVLGIDADTVDNKHASDFADAIHHHDDRYYTENEIDAMLQNVGGGDMYKSVYDTNNDGIVDAAESVPWNGITDKPTSFPPSSHNHPLSDITDHDKAAHDALGINADTLDGQHASAFAQASHTHMPIEVGLGNVTNDTQLKRAGNDFTGFTEKTTPADNDLILSEDSAASYAKKKITLGNIYLWLKGRFDSLYAALSHNHDASYYTKTQLNTSGAGGAVHWDNVTSKPSTFPPSTHQHAASDVTSGVFDAARIPNLNASKITSGTLSTDRFSAYADLQAENYFGFGSNQIARNVERAIAIRAVRNTTQTIPNATWTRIVLNNLISESKPLSMSSQWDSANGHFIVRQNGWYALFGAVTFEANSTGYRYVGIAKNNSVTNTLVNSGIMALSNVVSCIAVNTVAYLTSGETVSLWATQNSGGNLNAVYSYENWLYLAMALLFPV